MAKQLPATLKATLEDGDMPTEANFIDLIDSMNLDPSTVGEMLLTGHLKRSVTAGITAFAGGGQGSATQLTADINEITSVATAGDSVKLPTAVAGLEVVVINNDSTDACDVFPFSGDDLGAGVDTAASLAAGARIRYTSYNGTNWVVA